VKTSPKHHHIRLKGLSEKFPKWSCDIWIVLKPPGLRPICGLLLIIYQMADTMPWILKADISAGLLRMTYPEIPTEMSRQKAIGPYRLFQFQIWNISAGFNEILCRDHFRMSVSAFKQIFLGFSKDKEIIVAWWMVIRSKCRLVLLKINLRLLQSKSYQLSSAELFSCFWSSMFYYGGFFTCFVRAWPCKGSTNGIKVILMKKTQT